MPTLVLLGLGPGHPSHLSVDAVHKLAAADVIVVDSQADPAVFRPHVGEHAQTHNVDSTAPEAEDAARAEMIQLLRDGKRVVRARMSDGWSTAAALRDALVARLAGIEVEVVPGIDAAAGAWRAWLADRPLHGRRVVVTRMEGQASDTARALLERGADPWVVPTIELRALADLRPLDQALQHLDAYDLVAFTSGNGVDQTFARLIGLGRDARAFGSCAVAAIGTATARALTRQGIRADVIATEFRGEQLAEAILAHLGERPSRRVLIARAAEAREILPEMLRDSGCQVDVVAAYETVAPSAERVEPLRAALQKRQLDAVLLTSSSTVRNLCAMLGNDCRALLSTTVLASIDPITSSTARELGLEVGVEAEQFTIPGVIDALEKRFAL